MALNYYRLLGIPPDADQQRIRTVYRGLAKRFHPDTNKGSEAAAELFRQVNQAYQVLSDPEARAQYDRKLDLEEARQEQIRPGSTKSSRIDPQQKFNRFLNSLLDALVGPPDDPPAKTRPQPRSASAPKQQSDKTDFNIYYHQAVAKNSSPYICGRDGVYRKKKPTAPQQRRHTRTG